MSNVLESMLEQFANRHDGMCATRDGEGRCVLLASKALVLQFAHDSAADELRVFARMGRLPAPGRRRGDTEADAAAYGDEWESVSHERDGFQWTTAYNLGTGNLLLTACERMSALDSVSLGEWLERFVDRLTCGAEIMAPGA